MGTSNLGRVLEAQTSKGQQDVHVSISINIRAFILVQVPRGTLSSGKAQAQRWLIFLRCSN